MRLRKRQETAVRIGLHNKRAFLQARRRRRTVTARAAPNPGRIREC
jgi:hypothetical protein